jgi:hypothetical protein
MIYTFKTLGAARGGALVRRGIRVDAWGRRAIPHIVEMPINTEMGRGDYDQQLATYQLGNSTQEDTECQKCH